MNIRCSQAALSISNYALHYFPLQASFIYSTYSQRSMQSDWSELTTETENSYLQTNFSDNNAYEELQISEVYRIF